MWRAERDKDTICSQNQAEQRNRRNREPWWLGHTHVGESSAHFQPLRSQALAGQWFPFLSGCVSPALVYSHTIKRAQASNRKRKESSERPGRTSV